MHELQIPPPPGQSSTANRPSTLRFIFLADGQLRSGWGLALYILILALLFSVMGGLMHRLSPHLPNTALSNPGAPHPLILIPTLVNEALSLVCVCFATWIMSRVERRPLSTYGSGGPNVVRNLAAGLCWGIICLSLLVAALWRTHLLAFDGRQIFGAAILRYAAEWGLVFLLVALFEEYLMRGYLQFTLARALTALFSALLRTPNAPTLGFWTGALLLSILFGAGHGSNPGESPIGLLSAGIAGLVFCLALWRTGSLWWAIGFHATWDWAQSFLYGVADSGTMIQHHLFATHSRGTPVLSGGSTGPEGSILILPIFALIAAILLLVTPRRGGASLDIAAAPTAQP